MQNLEREQLFSYIIIYNHYIIIIIIVQKCDFFKCQTAVLRIDHKEVGKSGIRKSVSKLLLCFVREINVAWTTLSMVDKIKIK